MHKTKMFDYANILTVKEVKSEQAVGRNYFSDRWWSDTLGDNEAGPWSSVKKKKKKKRKK